MKNKGEKRTTTKKGDICGMRVREGNGTEREISIEAKNCTTKQNTKLKKFYEKVYERNIMPKKEIYIYVSLHPMVDKKPVIESRKKTNKVFLLINGLKAENCSLDIHFLSGVNRISVDELVQKLAPSITTTPTIQNLPGHINSTGTPVQQ
jgi:hypothetical protein